MKKFLTLFLAIFLLPIQTFASTITISSGNQIQVNVSSVESEKERSLTFKKFFEEAFALLAVREQIPDTYKYIDLKFINVQKGTTLYSALQKGVYMNFIENAAIALPLERTATEETLANLLFKITKVEYNFKKDKQLTLSELQLVINNLYKAQEVVDAFSSDEHYEILKDVFDRLQSEYYDASKIDTKTLIQGAIAGIASATGDKHTVYFPPVESQSFQDSLSSEFEGIGAYLEMSAPGVAKIISPLSGSPAEKAGLKGGDVITKVDDYTITKNDDLNAIVSKIKGKKGTTVRLEILRDTKTLQFDVVRDSIVMHYVETKTTGYANIPLIKISTFGEGVAKDFKAAVKKITETNFNKQLIIDLRNNPGGSLDEVSKILSQFVPEGQDVVKVKYRTTRSSIVASKTDLSLNDWKIVVLVNKGSASASEIMAGTIRDYLPTAKIIGETTYGKWSVQKLVPYLDGSSVKYTIAKWFTGKTATGIDGIGIVPDIEVISSTGSLSDTQLDRAIQEIRK